MEPNNSLVSELSTIEKLDGTNYDMWKLKIQYLLKERLLLEHLTIAKFPLSYKDKDGKPIDNTTM